MTLITVFRFKEFNAEHDRFVTPEPPVYATMEKIAALRGKPILSASLDVDDAQLTEQGFYRPQGETRTAAA